MDIIQIKETCLYVKDLEASKDFYNQKLSFEVIGEVAGSHVFFRVGTSVLLCFNSETSKEKENPPPHFAYGHQHIAFEVSPAEYDTWKANIQKLGIQIIQEQEWSNNLQSFYFLDPDKHVLEIIPVGIWD